MRITVMELVLTAVLASAAPALGASADILTLKDSIPLAKVSGRIDHMAIDIARHRLFVSELGNDTVDVVDLQTRQVIHRITGLSEPQGVGYVPGADLVVAANGGNGEVRIFSGADFSPRGALSLGGDADDLRVDPRNGHVLVGYGTGGIAVIDPKTSKKLLNVPMPAHPEGFQLAPSSGRIFVNVPDSRQIAIVDSSSSAAAGKWLTGRLSANYPMDLDDAGKQIAVVFRSPTQIGLFDTDSGAMKASAPTCGDADDVFFDLRRHLLYVSCGTGAVDVFAYDPTALRPVGRIASSRGARTSLFVPELDTLFVAAPGGLFGSNAAILEYRPQP